MDIAAILFGAGAIAGLGPVLVLSAQVFNALRPAAPSPSTQSRRPRVAVLIPAHNEASVIEATVRRIAVQLQAGDRVVVVADNCEDQTADLARQSGAVVLVRRDTHQRGKGYALEFGIRALEADPPEVVLVVDADCEVAIGSIDRLGRECVRSGRPVQALDLMKSPPGAHVGTRIAEFAWRVKNHARPLGMMLAGLPCQLMGTGMALPWSLVGEIRFGNASLAEDVAFGIDLALAGSPAMFCPDACVTSYFPAAETSRSTQRTRWEHGHLGAILVDCPRLLIGVVRRRDARLLALAADLAVPPIALLAMANTGLFTACLAFFALTSVAWPFAISACSASLLGWTIFVAWLKWGRESLTVRDLASVPVYALSKLPLYARFLVKPQKGWVKTGRD